MKTLIIEINTDSQFSKLAERTAKKLVSSLKKRAKVEIVEIETNARNEKVYVL
jgi:hypothetical protein